MCAKCSPRLSSHPPDDSEQFTQENLGGLGLQRKNAQRVRAEMERLWICLEGTRRRPPKSPADDKDEKWDGSRKKSLFWDASGNQNFIVNFGGDLLWRTSEGWAYAQEFPKGSGVSPRNHGGLGRKRPSRVPSFTGGSTLCLATKGTEILDLRASWRQTLRRFAVASHRVATSNLRVHIFEQLN